MARSGKVGENRKGGCNYASGWAPGTHASSLAHPPLYPNVKDFSPDKTCNVFHYELHRSWNVCFPCQFHSTRSVIARGDRGAMAEAQDAGSKKGWGWLRQVRLIPVSESAAASMCIRSLWDMEYGTRCCFCFSMLCLAC